MALISIVAVYVTTIFVTGPLIGLFALALAAAIMFCYFRFARLVDQSITSSEANPSDSALRTEARNMSIYLTLIWMATLGSAFSLYLIVLFN